MAKKKKAKVETKPGKPKPVLINLKVSEATLKMLNRKAVLYAQGNMSEWLRHAGLNYKPKRNELIR